MQKSASGIRGGFGETPLWNKMHENRAEINIGGSEGIRGNRSLNDNTSLQEITIGGFGEITLWMQEISIGTQGGFGETPLLNNIHQNPAEIGNGGSGGIRRNPSLK